MLAIASLNLAARGTRDQAARRQLVDVADRLCAHADAHRALAMPTPQARCDVGEYIARVCSALAAAIRSEPGLRLKLEVGDVALPSDRCWRLALIVSELVHNATRHGGRAGEILVELSSAGSQLVCAVSNAGGCECAPEYGRGRRVVLALTEELGGRADWVFTPVGARALVIVPLDGRPSGERQQPPIAI